MKNIVIFIVSGLILVSCQSSDCNNGIQDGNETGVDCGGNCTPCATHVPNSFEVELIGSWQLVETWQYDLQADTVLQVIQPWGSDCGAVFTSDIHSLYQYSEYTKFKITWKIQCVDEQLPWSRPVQDTIYIGGTGGPFRIVYIDSDSLVIKDAYQAQLEHHLVRN